MASSKKPPELSASGARDRALRALARREHSAAELKRKLQDRGHPEPAAAEVVENLSRAGWQSDARYAAMLLRSRIAQGYGPQRIEAELEQAGIAPAEIAAAMQAAGTDWKALAGTLHARRFRSAPASAADWQKQYRYLAARGFTPEQIHAALKHEPPE